MRILANENFPKEAVEALKERGHDVFWIREEKPGISDGEVLQIAQAEKRLLITFDKDFGALVFSQKLGTSEIGIVLFRIVPRSAEYIVKVAVAALDARTDWFGHFSVIEEDRVRMTVLPSLGLE